MSALNARILVVDDEAAVHREIEANLVPGARDLTTLRQAADTLFGSSPAPTSRDQFPFEVTCVSNGPEAVEVVAEALLTEQPYSVVFCDMRMPGWNGLQTVEELRKLDARIEVVILTAYSDVSVEELVDNLGVNISYMSKPFSSPDLKQMAIRLAVAWNQARAYERFIAYLQQVKGQEGDLEKILTLVCEELASVYKADSAAIIEVIDDGPVVRAGTGELSNRLIPLGLKFNQDDVSVGEATTDWLVHPLRDYGFAIIRKAGVPLSPESGYLARVLLDHTEIMIRNYLAHIEIRRQQRLLDVGQSVGFVFHDLRGQLGLIEMIVDRLKTGGRLRWTTETAYEKIQYALFQASRMADDILLYSKNDMRIEVVSTDIKQLLEANLDYWQYMSEALEVEFGMKIDGQVVALVDGERLVRALNNIVKNAMEATSIAGGEQRVQISVCTQSDLLLMVVQDTADGIPAEVMAKLFQPFSSRGKSHGTGFGLAIAHEVVSLHKGKITVETSDAGTTFRIELPLQ